MKFMNMTCQPRGLWEDPVRDEEGEHGDAEDELHLVPVGDAVGDGGRHKAPEGEVHVRHAPEYGLHLKSHEREFWMLPWLLWLGVS